MKIAIAIISLIAILYPRLITEYIPERTLEYYQKERLIQLKEHAERLLIINANIEYLMK